VKDSLLSPNRYQSEKEPSAGSTNCIRRERKLRGNVRKPRQREGRRDSSTDETKDCNSVKPNTHCSAGQGAAKPSQ